MPSFREHLISKFQESLANLNPEQYQAVAPHPDRGMEGTLVVVAGPGTGKTQLLAMRVASLLVHTDVSPEAIQCLTFSNTGVSELQQRLQQIIGPEAHQVQVATFHGFCNRLVLREPEAFGFGRNLSVVSDLEQHRLLKRLIERLPDDHILSKQRGDLYSHMKGLKNLFALMKKEGWTAESVTAAAQRYHDEAPTLDEFIYKQNGRGHKKGDVKQKQVDKAQHDMRQLMAMAALLPVYEQELKAKERYEYADMVGLVTRRLATDRDFRLDLQEQLQYLLVDEFQDTNGSQLELVLQLVQPIDSAEPDPAFHDPNLFVVGDDDQAIYRFQGAETEANFAKVFEALPNHQLVALTRNYRSTQAILDAAFAQIQANPNRLVNQEKLQALQPEAAGALLASKSEAPDWQRTYPHPKVVAYPTEAEATLYLADHLEALWNAEKGVPTEHRKGIAVLYRNHHQGEALFRVLAQRGVPAYQTRTANVLERPSIASLVHLLHYIRLENERPGKGEALLFDVLRAPWSSLSYSGLRLLHARYTLRHAQARTEARGQASTEGKELPPDYLRRMIGDTDPAFSLKDQEALVRWTSWLTRFEREWPHQPAALFVKNVAQLVGVTNWALHQPDGYLDIQALGRLVDFLGEEAERQAERPRRFGDPPGYDLPAALDTLEEMTEAGIPLEMRYQRGSELGIAFSTAHNAKGQQYDHVFLIAANLNPWKGSKRNEGFRLPPSLATDDTKRFQADERRLFYVAMTRARKQLEISYLKDGSATKDNGPQAFQLDELLANLPVSKYPNKYSKEDKASGWVKEEEAKPSHELTPFWQANLTTEALYASDTERRAVQELKSHYRLSPSGLNLWRKCPRSWYHEGLLRVPTDPTPAQLVGNAVHDALAHIMAPRLSGKPVAPLIELQSRYREALQAVKPLFPADGLSYKRYSAWAEEVLPGYYEQFVAEWNAVEVLGLEQTFYKRQLTLFGVPVTGTPDKIERLNGQLFIVDYKTGNPADPKLKPPHVSNSQTSTNFNQWRQLLFYVLLAEQELAQEGSVAGAYLEFVFPNEDTNGLRYWTENRAYLSDQALEEAARQVLKTEIETAWEQIQALEPEHIIGPDDASPLREQFCRSCPHCLAHQKGY